MRALQQAYRLLLRSSLPLATALSRMAEIGDPFVEEMIAFVRASRRGFHRAHRHTPTDV